AQTLYLAVQRPALSSQFGSFNLLAWVLAVFCFYGSLHHRNWAWAVFVLPIVLGLILVGTFFDRGDTGLYRSQYLLGAIHGTLLFLAAIGVCVGFVASLMYLVQARRLKSKQAPGAGIPLPSLERLEGMNRHSI